MTVTNFPGLTPTSRSFKPGDFANAKFRANSGAEFRILYGSKRTGMELQLQFQNITDAQANSILNHYDTAKGTYEVFSVPAAVKAGSSASIDPPASSKWRYKDAPQLNSVYPGVSSVTVNLIAATV